jgi:uncharacterized protein YceH (UPF0502 family)
VLAELLLRGPQTEGELRPRAGRMEPIDDLDALRAVLRPLVERKLVIYLTPEDRRGAVLTHGFHDPAELGPLRTRSLAEPAAAAPPVANAPGSPGAPPAPGLDKQLAEAREDIAGLRQTVAALRGEIDGLREELRQFKQSLGA